MEANKSPQCCYQALMTCHLGIHQTKQLAVAGEACLSSPKLVLALCELTQLVVYVCSLRMRGNISLHSSDAASLLVSAQPCSVLFWCLVSSPTARPPHVSAPLSCGCCSTKRNSAKPANLPARFSNHVCVGVSSFVHSQRHRIHCGIQLELGFGDEPSCLRALFAK